MFWILKDKNKTNKQNQNRAVVEGSTLALWLQISIFYFSCSWALGPAGKGSEGLEQPLVPAGSQLDAVIEHSSPETGVPAPLEIFSRLLGWCEEAGHWEKASKTSEECYSSCQSSSHKENTLTETAALSLTLFPGYLERKQIGKWFCVLVSRSLSSEGIICSS